MSIDGSPSTRRFYSAILEYHHHNEDHDEFPVLIGYYPDIKPLIEEFGADHFKIVTVLEEIDGAVRAFEQDPDDSGRDRINAGVVELRDLFSPRLDREDADVIPMYAQWIPPKQWDQMNTKALRGIPKPHMAYGVGALDETIRSLPAADRPPGLPLPVRVMLALS